VIKRHNLETSLLYDSFMLHETDLRTGQLAALVDGCDTLIHLAAMPGLRRSWSDFQLYCSCNVEGTQRLLEAAVEAKVKHFIHGSTSSVYGKEALGPETSPLQPYSPYGLTKLAAEHLCRAYAKNFEIPITILRFFSVYGPRQRPDMAYSILMDCLMHNRPFQRFGDGEQSRSNTFVADCVSAILLAADQPERAKAETFNVGGGEVVSLNEVIRMLQEITGRQLKIEERPALPGDQAHTRADSARIREMLGFNPTTPVREGLEAQVAWFQERSPEGSR